MQCPCKPPPCPQSQPAPTPWSPTHRQPRQVAGVLHRAQAHHGHAARMRQRLQPLRRRRQGGARGTQEAIERLRRDAECLDLVACAARIWICVCVCVCVCVVLVCGAGGRGGSAAQARAGPSDGAAAVGSRRRAAAGAACVQRLCRLQAAAVAATSARLPQLRRKAGGNYRRAHPPLERNAASARCKNEPAARSSGSHPASSSGIQRNTVTVRTRGLACGAILAGWVFGAAAAAGRRQRGSCSAAGAGLSAEQKTLADGADVSFMPYSFVSSSVIIVLGSRSRTFEENRGRGIFSRCDGERVFSDHQTLLVV